jgi:hypothetical protein
VVGEIFALFPQVQWISSLNPVIWNRSGQAVGAGSLEGFSRGSFMRGGNIAGQPWFARGWIQQESTFWRRSLWEQAGGAVALELAFDFDLWARFYQHADLYGVRALLGGIRRHGEQKTARLHDQYVREVVAILSRHGGRPYSASASSLRHLARRLQQKPATRRRPLNALLAATGLMLPARNIVFNEETETWEIRERLVV